MTSIPKAPFYARPVLIVLLLVVNLYLTISLSHWDLTVFSFEIGAAVILAFVSICNFVRHKKSPSVLQLVLWLCLIMPWFLHPLRAKVLDRRIEGIGTVRLLEEARWLGEFIGDDHKPMEMNGENLMVPPSILALSPETVRVQDEEVVVVLRAGVADEDAFVISTDKNIVAGPLYPKRETKQYREGSKEICTRPIAPGITWYYSSD